MLILATSLECFISVIEMTLLPGFFFYVYNLCLLYVLYPWRTHPSSLPQRIFNPIRTCSHTSSIAETLMCTSHLSGNLYQMYTACSQSCILSNSYIYKSGLFRSRNISKTYDYKFADSASLNITFTSPSICLIRRMILHWGSLEPSSRVLKLNIIEHVE